MFTFHLFGLQFGATIYIFLSLAEIKQSLFRTFWKTFRSPLEKSQRGWLLVGTMLYLRTIAVLLHWDARLGLSCENVPGFCTLYIWLHFKGLKLSELLFSPLNCMVKMSMGKAKEFSLAFGGARHWLVLLILEFWIMHFIEQNQSLCMAVEFWLSFLFVTGWCSKRGTWRKRPSGMYTTGLPSSGSNPRVLRFCNWPLWPLECKCNNDLYLRVLVMSLSHKQSDRWWDAWSTTWHSLVLNWTPVKGSNKKNILLYFLYCFFQ